MHHDACESAIECGGSHIVSGASSSESVGASSGRARLPSQARGRPLRRRSWAASEAPSRESVWPQESVRGPPTKLLPLSPGALRTPARPAAVSLKQSNPSNDPTRSPSGKRDVVFTQPAAAAGHFPAKVASFVCKARRICFCARLSKHSLSLLSRPQGRRRLSQRRNLGVTYWKSP
jgi:hypothetical protein